MTMGSPRTPKRLEIVSGLKSTRLSPGVRSISQLTARPKGTKLRQVK